MTMVNSGLKGLNIVGPNCIYLLSSKQYCDNCELISMDSGDSGTNIDESTIIIRQKAVSP